MKNANTRLKTIKYIVTLKVRSPEKVRDLVRLLRSE